MKIYAMEPTNEALSVMRTTEILSNLVSGTAGTDYSKNYLNGLIALEETIHIKFSSTSHTWLELIGFSAGSRYIPVPQSLNRSMTAKDTRATYSPEYPIPELFKLIKLLIGNEGTCEDFPLIIYTYDPASFRSINVSKIQNIVTSIKNCHNKLDTSQITINVEVATIDEETLMDVTETADIICPPTSAYRYGAVPFDMLVTKLTQLHNMAILDRKPTYVRFMGNTPKDSKLKITEVFICGVYHTTQINGINHTLGRPTTLTEVVDILSAETPYNCPPIFMIKNKDHDNAGLLTLGSISFKQYSMIDTELPNEVVFDLVSINKCMRNAYFKYTTDCIAVGDEEDDPVEKYLGG